MQMVDSRNNVNLVARFYHITLNKFLPEIFVLPAALLHGPLLLLF